MDHESKKRRRPASEGEGHELDSYQAPYDTLLHAAVMIGNDTEVEQLVKTTPLLVNLKNGAGETALHCAARSGNLVIIKHLLNAQADAYAQNLDDKTPLHIAVETGNMNVVQLLLSETLILTRDKTGLTPVAVAVLKKNQVMVKHLLKIFPEALCTVTIQGRSPLHLAAEMGDAAMLRLLLGYNYIVNKDHSGKTALHLAVIKGAADAVEVLLDAGMDATLQDKEGETALHFACAKGYKKIVELLMQRVPELFIIGNKVGEMPLHYVQPEHSALMQWFMQYALGNKALMCVIPAESLVDTSIFNFEEEIIEGQGGVADFIKLRPLVSKNALAVALMYSYSLEEAAELLDCLEGYKLTYNMVCDAISKNEPSPQIVQNLIENMIKKIMRFYATYVLALNYTEGLEAVMAGLQTFNVDLFFKEQLRAFPVHSPEVFMYQITLGETALVRQWRSVFKDCLSTEPWFVKLYAREKSTVRRFLNIPVDTVSPTVPMQQFSTIAPRMVISPQSNTVPEVVKFSGLEPVI